MINKPRTSLVSAALLGLALSVWGVGSVNVQTYAQESEVVATSSGQASESGALDPETRNSLKERIEKVITEKEEVIEERVQERLSQKQVLIGQVERLSEDSLTLRTTSGVSFIGLDETVELRNKNKENRITSIEVEEISVDDWVVVTGSVNGESFTPEQVTVRENSPRPRDYTLFIGTITEVSRSELTLQPRATETEETMLLNSNTLIQDNAGLAIERTDLTKDLQALLIVYTDDDDDQVISTLRLLISNEDLEVFAANSEE